jgi:hypothetical protein
VLLCRYKENKEKNMTTEEWIEWDKWAALYPKEEKESRESPLEALQFTFIRGKNNAYSV